MTYKSEVEFIDIARKRVKQGRLDEAVQAYKAQLKRNMNDDTALRELFWAQIGLKDFSGALATVARLEGLGLEIGRELSRVTLAFMHMCEWSHGSALHDRLSARLKTGNACIVDVFSMLASVDDPAEHLAMGRCIARAIAKHVARLPHPPSVGTAELRGRRLRVGYLCGNFNQHPMSQLMAGVLERHDRSCFEVTAYDYSPEDGSAVRSRIIRALERFVRLGMEGPAKCAARIAADKLDILIDLTGYTEGTRSEIMAFRPAPVQATFLGYVGTHGGSWIDYVIADRHVLPSSEHEHWCEKVCYLPNSYYPNDRSRPIPGQTKVHERKLHGLPPTGFVFACFNNCYKITPHVFNLWMECLRCIPGSVLWLYEGNEFVARNLRREARRAGIGVDRLIFAPPLPFSSHMDRHAYADLFLDTMPYGAHTTGADALWAGLPMITLRGRSFASRVGSSLLQAVKLPEMICDTPDEYVSLALSLARDPLRLAAIREALIQARTTCSLFDAECFARNLEAAFTRMVTAKATCEQQ